MGSPPKPAHELQPVDLGFKVWKTGEQVPHGSHPFYEFPYISRTATTLGYRNDETLPREYDEKGLRQALREGRSFVLFGQPLDGKSRTLYQVVSSMRGYSVLQPDAQRGVPDDDDFSLLLKNLRIILLLDDLPRYVGSELDLQEFTRRLNQNVDISWVVAATCRDDKRRMVQTELGTFYENIHLKLWLGRVSAADKGQLAEALKIDWDPKRSDDYPTLGSITMKEAMEAMIVRFDNLFDEHPERADILRAVKLLDKAGVRCSLDRVKAVIEYGPLFPWHGLDISHPLRLLEEQSFLHILESEVQPEPAYLRNVVNYREGRRPEDDFDKLAEVLTGLQDAEGLVELGIAYGSNQERALLCFEQATKLKDTYPQAWSSKAAALSELGRFSEASEAFERAIDLRPDYPNARSYLGRPMTTMWARLKALRNLGIMRIVFNVHWRQLRDQLKERRYRDFIGTSLLSLTRVARDTYPPEVWYDLGLALGKLGYHAEALEAFEQAASLRPDFPEAWLNKGVALIELDRFNEALEAFEQATSLRPDFPEAWLNKGVILSKLGRPKEAIRVLEQTPHIETISASTGEQIS